VLVTLVDELRRQNVGMAFSRVSESLRADMDRHGVTAALGAGYLFPTRHAALRAVRGANSPESN